MEINNVGKAVVDFLIKENVQYVFGMPGVVLFTAGPGATNSITSVAQAYASSLPLIHITGDAPLKAGNEAFHGVDQADYLHKMFNDITKWSVRIENAEESNAIEKSFELSINSPVVLDIVCGYEFPWPVKNLVLKSLDASK